MGKIEKFVKPVVTTKFGNEKVDELLKKYKDEQVNTIDGVKIDFAEEWVHLRKSNTEPIMRIYAEASNHKQALELVARIKKIL